MSCVATKQWRALCIRRANCAETFDPWILTDQLPTGSHWWCACVLEADFGRLGFERASTSMSSSNLSAWDSEASSLPAKIQHLIVVPPRPGTAAFYQVRRDEARVRLYPIKLGRSGVPLKDYWQVRVAALDLVLSELLARTS